MCRGRWDKHPVELVPAAAILFSDWKQSPKQAVFTIDNNNVFFGFYFFFIEFSAGCCCFFGEPGESLPHTIEKPLHCVCFMSQQSIKYTQNSAFFYSVISPGSRQRSLKQHFRQSNWMKPYFLMLFEIFPNSCSHAATASLWILLF